MPDFSRRGFLGGALSLLFVAKVDLPTFVPSPSEGNWMPRIYGNGRDYDGEGLQALFDGKDVIFPADKIGVRAFTADGNRAVQGIIFHHGNFVIDRELYTNGRHLFIESASFDGRLLHWWEAFFTIVGRGSRNDAQKIIGKASWQRSEGHMALDIGGTQFSISNVHMSDQERFRPKIRSI